MATNDEIRINPKDIPDSTYQTASRILDTSVKRYFTLPGVREKYEEWMKTEEGQLADLPPEERKKRREAAKIKEQHNEQMQIL